MHRKHVPHLPPFQLISEYIRNELLGIILVLTEMEIRINAHGQVFVISPNLLTLKAHPFHHAPYLRGIKATAMESAIIQVVQDITSRQSLSRT